jgi:hypothetical protein
MLLDQNVFRPNDIRPNIVLVVLDGKSLDKTSLDVTSLDKPLLDVTSLDKMLLDKWTLYQQDRWNFKYFTTEYKASANLVAK